VLEEHLPPITGARRSRVTRVKHRYVDTRARTGSDEIDAAIWDAAKTRGARGRADRDSRTTSHDRHG